MINRYDSTKSVYIEPAYDSSYAGSVIGEGKSVIIIILSVAVVIAVGMIGFVAVRKKKKA